MIPSLVLVECRKKLACPVKSNANKGMAIRAKAYERKRYQDNEEEENEEDMEDGDIRGEMKLSRITTGTGSGRRRCPPALAPLSQLSSSSL
jgi:hypothetical protein